MKKFGINKKDKIGEELPEDSSRSRLFGSRSKTKSPAPTSSNPYAAPSVSTADPYASSAASYGSSNSYSTNYSSIAQPASQPPPYDIRNGYGSYSDNPIRNNKSSVPAGGYGSDRYGGNSYSGQGYGGERSEKTLESGSAYQRTGAYGGLGGIKEPETQDDPGRNALFGDAQERYEQRQAKVSQVVEDNSAQGYGAGENDASNQAYGSYQEKQLTAEEEEEENVQGVKQQIRAIKQQDVSSTRNALRIADQAEQTGRETLERLGAQGERIHNTEKNLDLAANQNRLAEDKAKELKHLNRSMWAMHVGNPFTKARRERDRDEMIIAQHQSDRTEREATRQAAYSSQSRQQETQRNLRGAPGVASMKGNLAERSKYQFEADSEDEAMEEEIDSNLDALHGAAGRLNQLGRAMGKEVDSQNEHITRIVGKADKVDDGIALNRTRLDRLAR